MKYIAMDVPIPCDPETVQKWLNGLAGEGYRLVASYIYKGWPVFVFEKIGK